MKQPGFKTKLFLSLSALLSVGHLQAQGKEIFQNRGPAVFIARIHHNGTPVGSGSAFILNHNGKKYGVTNHHVVAPGAIFLEKDGKKFEGVRILRVNDSLDVAIFDFPGIQDLPAVDAASYSPSEGERVYVLGYPGVSTDGGPVTELRLNITEGLVSNARLLRKRPGGIEHRYVQLTAALNHGNSGGPVFGEKGDVIGMATGGRKDLNQVGWAVPCDEIVHEIDRIATHSETVDEDTAGVHDRLASLVENSSDLTTFGAAFSPDSRSKAIDAALRSAERVRQSVVLTREKTGLRNDNASAFIDDMATRLRKDDMFFFLVLQVVLSKNKNETLDHLKSDPHRFTGLYLGARFMGQIVDRLGRGEHKYLLKSFKVVSLSFDDGRKRADASVEFQTETDKLVLPVKLEKEWGTWFLAL